MLYQESRKSSEVKKAIKSGIFCKVTNYEVNYLAGCCSSLGKLLLTQMPGGTPFNQFLPEI